MDRGAAVGRELHKRQPLKIAGLFALGAACLLLLPFEEVLWRAGNLSSQAIYSMMIVHAGPNHVARTLLRYTSTPWWFGLMALVYWIYPRIAGRSLHNRWGWIHLCCGALAATIYWSHLVHITYSAIPGWHAVVYRQGVDWLEVLAIAAMLAGLAAFGLNLTGEKRGGAVKKWGRPQAAPKNPD